MTDSGDGLDCCPGEPAYGDPKGLHSRDCPVYTARAEAMSEVLAGRTRADLAARPPLPARRSPALRMVDLIPGAVAREEWWVRYRLFRDGGETNTGRTTDRELAEATALVAVENGFSGVLLMRQVVVTLPAEEVTW